MRKWCTEDWREFELTTTDGKAGHCRLGLEKGGSQPLLSVEKGAYRVGLEVLLFEF